MGELTTVLGAAGANIVEILHQRMFVDLSARSARVEVTVETLDLAHADRVIAALRAEGYVVRVASFVTRDSLPDTGV
jgi:threonine dehydratase